MVRILSPKSFSEGENVGGMTGSKKVKAKKANIDGIDEGTEFQLKSSILTVDALDAVYKKFIKSKNSFLQEENPYDQKSPFNKKNIQKDFDKESKSKGFSTRTLSNKEIEKRKDTVIKNIRSASLSGLGRKVKSGGHDNELFSETIASIVSESLTKSDVKDTFKMTPKVSLVYSKETKDIKITSEYFKNVLGTLDDYAMANGSILGKEKHINISINQDGNKTGKGYFNIGGPAQKQLRTDLTKCVALSILHGDHDVNPGNMLVIKDDKGNDRIARIDYGHAFNDLIVSPFGNKLKFGAGIYNPNNRVIDFLNRPTICHASKKNQVPKLWRDFSDISPSIELAQALKEVGGSDTTKKGIENAKEHFINFINQLDEKSENDKEIILHVKESLNKIAHALGHKKVSIKLTLADFIDATFDVIDSFYDKGQKDMLEAAELMELQCGVEELAKNAVHNELDEATIKAQYNEFKRKYIKIKDCEGIRSDDSFTQIEWLKIDKESKAFIGSLDSFFESRIFACTQAEIRKNAKIYEDATLGTILSSEARIDNKEKISRDYGKFSGIYKIDGKINSVKKENDESKNIAGFMASKLFENLRPGFAVKTSLVRFDDENDVYLASEAFDNYNDLYVDIYEKAGEKIPNSRPRIVDSETREIFRQGLNNGGYKGFAESMVSSLLVGDFNLHWGNVGVINEQGKEPKLVRGNLASAFKNLGKDVNPHSISEHIKLEIPKDGYIPKPLPTNHFREYPRSMKLSSEFIDELNHVSKQDVSKVINDSIEELKKYYPDEKIVQFGKNSGIKDAKTVGDVSLGLISLLQKRQKSLKDFATELEIDKCIREVNGEWKIGSYVNREGKIRRFNEVVKDNPEYFKQVLDGKKKITFYDLNHKDSFNIMSSTASWERLFRAVISSLASIFSSMTGYKTTEEKITNLVNNNVAKQLNYTRREKLSKPYERPIQRKRLHAREL